MKPTETMKEHMADWQEEYKNLSTTEKEEYKENHGQNRTDNTSGRFKLSVVDVRESKNIMEKVSTAVRICSLSH